MATPLSKRNPPWLALQSEADVANKHYKRSIRYYKQLYMAWPEWADCEAMASIYREAAERRAAGEDVQVDHMVPIKSSEVCGLHCEFNLRIIARIDNLSKGNNWWPNMWVKQYTLELSNEDQA